MYDYYIIANYLHVGMQRRCPYIGYIRCKSSAQCIHPHGICNGYNNCQDGTDEENCGK